MHDKDPMLMARSSIEGRQVVADALMSLLLWMPLAQLHQWQALSVMLMLWLGSLSPLLSSINGRHHL